MSFVPLPCPPSTGGGGGGGNFEFGSDVENQILCDVVDGEIVGSALAVYEYSEETGDPIGPPTFVDPVTGAPYVPQGTLQPCSSVVNTVHLDENVAEFVLCEAVVFPGPPSNVLIQPFIRKFIQDDEGNVIDTVDLSMNGTPYNVTGAVQACDLRQPSRVAEILCDANGDQFLRFYSLVPLSADQEAFIQEVDLDGQPFTPVDPVGTCPETTVYERILCDVDVLPNGDVFVVNRFIRKFFQDENGNVINTVDIHATFGTPYVVQGTISDCDEDEEHVFHQLLCDDNGPFLRLWNVDFEGNISQSVPFVDYEIDGTPYTVVGDIVVCPVETEPNRFVSEFMLCDVRDNNPDPGFTKVEFFRKFIQDADGNVLDTVDISIFGTPFVPTGFVGRCERLDTERFRQILCDAGNNDTPFIRTYVYQGSEFILIETQEVDLEGNDYVVVGPVERCSEEVNTFIQVEQACLNQDPGANFFANFPTTPGAWELSNNGGGVYNPNPPAVVNQVVGPRGTQRYRQTFVIPPGLTGTFTVRVEGDVDDGSVGDPSEVFYDAISQGTVPFPSGPQDFVFPLTAGPHTFELYIGESDENTGLTAPRITASYDAAGPGISIEIVKILDSDGDVTNIRYFNVNGVEIQPAPTPGQVTLGLCSQADNADPEFDVEQLILCDTGNGNLPFIRRFTFDSLTGNLETTVNYLLDGNEYVGFVGPATRCDDTLNDNDVEIEVLCDDGNGNAAFLRRYVYDIDGNLVGTTDTELDGSTPYVLSGNAVTCEGGANIQVEPACLNQSLSQSFFAEFPTTPSAWEFSNNGGGLYTPNPPASTNQAIGPRGTQRYRQTFNIPAGVTGNFTVTVSGDISDGSVNDPAEVFYDAISQGTVSLPGGPTSFVIPAVPGPHTFELYIGESDENTGITAPVIEVDYEGAGVFTSIEIVKVLDDGGGILNVRYFTVTGQEVQPTPSPQQVTLGLCSQADDSAVIDTEVEVLCDTGNNDTQFLRRYSYNLDGDIASFTDTELDGTTAYVSVGPATKCFPDTFIQVEPACLNQAVGQSFFAEFPITPSAWELSNNAGGLYTPNPPATVNQVVGPRGTQRYRQQFVIPPGVTGNFTVTVSGDISDGSVNDPAEVFYDAISQGTVTVPSGPTSFVIPAVPGPHDFELWIGESDENTGLTAPVIEVSYEGAGVFSSIEIVKVLDAGGAILNVRYFTVTGQEINPTPSPQQVQLGLCSEADDAEEDCCSENIGEGCWDDGVDTGEYIAVRTAQGTIVLYDKATGNAIDVADIVDCPPTPLDSLRDVEQEFLCDAGNDNTRFVRRYTFDGSTGDLVSTEDLLVDGTPYLVFGPEVECASPSPIELGEFCYENELLEVRRVKALKCAGCEDDTVRYFDVETGEEVLDPTPIVVCDPDEPAPIELGEFCIALPFTETFTGALGPFIPQGTGTLPKTLSNFQGSGIDVTVESLSATPGAGIRAQGGNFMHSGQTFQGNGALRRQRIRLSFSSPVQLQRIQAGDMDNFANTGERASDFSVQPSGVSGNAQFVNPPPNAVVGGTLNANGNFQNILWANDLVSDIEFDVWYDFNNTPGYAAHVYRTLQFQIDNADIRRVKAYKCEGCDDDSVRYFDAATGEELFQPFDVVSCPCQDCTQHVIVDNFPEGTEQFFTQEILCDQVVGEVDVQFIRTFVFNDQGDLSETRDFNLDGTDYLVQGTVRRCGEPSALITPTLNVVTNATPLNIPAGAREVRLTVADGRVSVTVGANPAQTVPSGASLVWTANAGTGDNSDRLGEAFTFVGIDPPGFASINYIVTTTRE